MEKKERKEMERNSKIESDSQSYKNTKRKKNDRKRKKVHRKTETRKKDKWINTNLYKAEGTKTEVRKITYSYKMKKTERKVVCKEDKVHTHKHTNKRGRKTNEKANKQKQK